MTITECCIRGFAWDGTPTGRVGRLAENDAYIAEPAGFSVDGSSSSSSTPAVLLVADLLGWTFPNVRLLADHLARESGAVVYVPDFFAGEVMPPEPVLAARWSEVDLHGFIARHGREIREPEIVACARALRARHPRVGAVGFCYGGWAVFRLGSRAFFDADGKPLVDCAVAGHPSLLTKQDIDEVEVPVQLLAPEIDQGYTEELKLHTFQRLALPRADGKAPVPFDYHHFPGVEHGALVRGDASKPGERAAMIRAKDAAVAWLQQWLAVEGKERKA